MKTSLKDVLWLCTFLGLFWGAFLYFRTSSGNSVYEATNMAGFYVGLGTLAASLKGRFLLFLSVWCMVAFSATFAILLSGPEIAFLSTQGTLQLIIRLLSNAIFPALVGGTALVLLGKMVSPQDE